MVYNLELCFNLLDSLQLKGYPANPETIGEHIRKKRIDLGLMQKEVAGIIGVTESSIWNWEHGMNPGKRYMKRIEGFLSRGLLSFQKKY